MAGAVRLGIALQRGQVERFERYGRELLAWNQRLNLTAITAWDEIITKHFLDSLTVALALPKPVGPGTGILDVGAGAGFPGIPLKIAFPEIRLALLESAKKKAAFLEQVTQALGLKGVTVIAERAEEAARMPEHREAYQVVVARALAPFPVLVELTLPFSTVGGMVVAQKKGDIALEIAQAGPALQRLGGRLRECRPVALPGLEDGRVLVIVDKVAATPQAYPRRPGMPAKRPLA